MNVILFLVMMDFMIGLNYRLYLNKTLVIEN